MENERKRLVKLGTPGIIFTIYGLVTICFALFSESSIASSFALYSFGLVLGSCAVLLFLQMLRCIPRGVLAVPFFAIGGSYLLLAGVNRPVIFQSLPSMLFGFVLIFSGLNFLRDGERAITVLTLLAVALFTFLAPGLSHSLDFHFFYSLNTPRLNPLGELVLSLPIVIPIFALFPLIFIQEDPKRKNNCP